MIERLDQHEDVLRGRLKCYHMVLKRMSRLSKIRRPPLSPLFKDEEVSVIPESALKHQNSSLHHSSELPITEIPTKKDISNRRMGRYVYIIVDGRTEMYSADSIIIVRPDAGKLQEVPAPKDFIQSRRDSIRYSLIGVSSPIPERLTVR